MTMMFRTLAFIIGLLLITQAEAATLYITEYANGVSTVGTTQPQVPPVPATAVQTVSVGGASLQSAAFASSTHVVGLTCDVGCSISFGSNPTATTSTTLLQQGVTYLFGTTATMKVAVIANTAGNTGGASGSAVTQGTSPWIVAGGGTAGTAATGVVTVQGIASATPVVVGGNVASAATDSGNPVKIGGLYTSGAQPFVTTGQRANLAVTKYGSIRALVTGQSVTGSDGYSNTAVALATSDGGDVDSPVLPLQGLAAFNGTSFDRVRLAGSTLGLLTENGPYLLGRATADTQIKSSAGFVHTVSIAALTATPTAGLLTLYCNTAESGTVLYAEWIFATDVGHTVTLDIPCSTGIYAGFDATLANVQATISYR